MGAQLRHGLVSEAFISKGMVARWLKERIFVVTLARANLGSERLSAAAATSATKENTTYVNVVVLGDIVAQEDEDDEEEDDSV